MIESTCIRCGCTDSNACPGGCSWFIVYRRHRIGVCTRCRRGGSQEAIRCELRRFYAAATAITALGEAALT